MTERPRRAVFFDVENSSRPERIALVLRELAADDVDTTVAAIGNWRVVSLETARLLARAGAEMIHSAPAFGVKDWSDLRIAVAAGLWLATARATDAIEIVSDDQAFDAVGDLAATRGVLFRRRSLREYAAADGGSPARARPRAGNRRRRPPRRR